LFDFVGLVNSLEEKLDKKVGVTPVDTVRKEIRERALIEAVHL